MDIKREGVAAAKRRRRILYGAIALAVVALVTLGLYRLEPAAPSVDAATVWRDTVKRGEMLRQVRGPGTLVPEEIRRIALNTAATVERRLILPGAVVEPDTVILELSNPTLEQETQDAALALVRGRSGVRRSRGPARLAAPQRPGGRRARRVGVQAVAAPGRGGRAAAARGSDPRHHPEALAAQGR